MTDICLDSADQERISPAVLQKHVGNAVQLNGIAHGSTSSVTLKVGGLIGVEISSKRVCCANDLFLANSTGLCDTTGLAVCVGSSTSDHTTDGVTVAEGIGESLEVQRSDAFSSAVSISRCIESMARGGCFGSVSTAISHESHRKWEERLGVNIEGCTRVFGIFKYIFHPVGCIVKKIDEANAEIALL